MSITRIHPDDISEIIAKIKEYDYQFRPYAIVCHSHYRELLEENFGDRYVIAVSPYCDIGNVYIVSRKDFDNMDFNPSAGDARFSEFSVKSKS